MMMQAVVRPTEGKHLVFGPDGNRRWAHQGGLTESEAYAPLPNRLVDLCSWALEDHKFGAVSVWLLQEYNLRRDGETANTLLHLAIETMSALADSALAKYGIIAVGELDALDRVRSGSSARVSTVASSVDLGAPRIRVMIAYNADKELLRALRCCEADGVEPTFANLSGRWSIPPVDVLMRTGQPAHMTNLSSYFPGIERGRVLTTSLTPMEFGREDFADLVDSYRTSPDSIGTTLRSPMEG